MMNFSVHNENWQEQIFPDKIGIHKFHRNEMKFLKFLDELMPRGCVAPPP